MFKYNTFQMFTNNFQNAIINIQHFVYLIKMNTKPPKNKIKEILNLKKCRVKSGKITKTKYKM